jgi:hypothetical protein
MLELLAKGGSFKKGKGFRKEGMNVMDGSRYNKNAVTYTSAKSRSTTRNLVSLTVNGPAFSVDMVGGIEL